MKITRLYGFGSGGKGGGGGVESPDTLQSKAYISLIDLISEGPIEGFCNAENVTIVDAVLTAQPDVVGGAISFSDSLWVTDLDGVVIGKKAEVSSLAYTPIVNLDNQGYPFSVSKPIKLEFYGLTEVLSEDAETMAEVHVIVYPKTAAEKTAYLAQTRFDHLRHLAEWTTFTNSLKIYPEGKVRGLYLITAGSEYVAGSFIVVVPRAIGAAVFFDGVPVCDPEDLSPRLKDIGLQYRLGYEDQSVMSGFQVVRELFDLSENNEVTYADTGAVNAWDLVFETPFQSNFDALIVDITFSNGLHLIDLEKGNIQEYWVDIAFQQEIGRLQTDGSVLWTDLPDTLVTSTVRGKTMSAYERSYNITLQRPSITENYYWRIKMQRRSIDDVSPTPVKSSTKRESTFKVVRVTAKTNEKLNYPYSAVIGIRVNAEQFNRIPVRSYQVKLIKCLVPDNYFPPYSIKIVKDAAGNEISRSVRQHAEYCRDPETGDGVYDTNGNPIDQEWTGDFYISWTNNPAWIAFTVCLNQRWGLGKVIPSASKWWHYKLGRYCDEKGHYSGTGNPEEPRYTCNTYFQTREEAFKVLQDLSSVFAGYYYYGGGAVVPVWDAPKKARLSFSPANVEDGLFTYRGTQRKVRHTVAVVRYVDPNSGYKLAPVYVEDWDGIARYGYNTIEKDAFACTSQGQARRQGKRILRMELSNTDTVSFVTGVQASVLLPGDVIEVCDPTRSTVPFGGRIMAVLENPADGLAGIIADREISDDALCRAAGVATFAEIDPGQFGLVCAKPTSELDWAAVKTEAEVDKMLQSQLTAPLRIAGFSTDAEGRRLIKLAEGLPSGVIAGMMWSLQHANVRPQYFTVINVEETEKHKFAVSGLEYHEQIYDEIFEDENYWEDPITPDLDYWKRPGKPRNLLLRFTTLRNQGNVAYELSASWSPPELGFAREYEVHLKKNLGNFQLYTKTKDYQVEMIINEPDSYTVRVYAVGITGLKSDYAEANIGYLSGENQEIISGLEVLRQGNDHNFYGGDLYIDWRINWSGADSSLYTGLAPDMPGSIDSYKLVLYDANGVTLQEYNLNRTDWSLTLDQNFALPSGPYRDMIVEVRARTNDLKLSAPTRIRVTNSRPSVLTANDIIVTNNELGLFLITFVTSTAGADFSGYRVFGSLTSGFTPAANTLLWEGNSKVSAGMTIAEATNPDTIYFRVAEYDHLGAQNVLDCNISDEMSVNVHKTVGLTTLSVFDFLGL